MAKAGLIDVMEAMADQIREVVDAITDVNVQVEPKMVLLPTPPCIDIYPGDASRFQDSRAYADDGGYQFTVRARVTTADTSAGQDLLLAFMDDTDDLCIGLALVDDPTLNGYASSVDIRDHTGYRLFEHPSGDGAYLGFQFTAIVLPAES